MARKRTDNRGSAGIADNGRAVAATRKEGTRHAIERAMREIESDIERNGGIYPYAEGEVSTAEVLRRTGLSPTRTASFAASASAL